MVRKVLLLVYFLCISTFVLGEFEFEQIPDYGCNYTTHRGGYNKFFNMKDILNLKTTETDLIDIRIAVTSLGQDEPHILISETDNPGYEDDVLEIVLQSNLQSWTREMFLHRRMGHEMFAYNIDFKILIPGELNGYQLRITKEGLIDVYSQDGIALLHGDYGRNISANFVAFSCGGSCTFYFDCVESRDNQPTEANETNENCSEEYPSLDNNWPPIDPITDVTPETDTEVPPVKTTDRQQMQKDIMMEMQNVLVEALLKEMSTIDEKQTDLLEKQLQTQQEILEELKSLNKYL